MVQWEDINSRRSTAKLVGRSGRHRSNPAHLYVLPLMRRSFFAAEAAKDVRVNDTGRRSTAGRHGWVACDVPVARTAAPARTEHLVPSV
jgi:hypothetical protein